MKDQTGDFCIKPTYSSTIIFGGSTRIKLIPQFKFSKALALFDIDNLLSMFAKIATKIVNKNKASKFKLIEKKRNETKENPFNPKEVKK